MGRNLTTATSASRSRVRVTNKTRLKIVLGDIEADPFVIEEDEEKARLVSTAGVDAEDADEHHLQAVLSAALQHQLDAKAKGPQAYIPVPESREVLEGYSDLYPSGHWIDPFNHNRSSESVEESTRDGIETGCTYYTDERDQEWLTKNNEEARGEGTSAQGVLSSGGVMMRSGLSPRSVKSKGKDPDVTSAIAMTDDEFELVMGIFEKVTHDKTEYLHHGLEQGMAFPPFSDYQDTFASKLSVSIFATFVVPKWVPAPARLIRLARVIYPYWRDRRLERGGHRIIPTINLDEADTNNETFICFRRRESKAVRKTRASQVSYSEKLVRLKGELALAQDLSSHVCKREVLKKVATQEAQQLWERRLTFMELKMRFPSSYTKDDEELLVDKERVTKKSKTDASVSNRPSPVIKLRTRENRDTRSPTPRVEAIVKPSDRTAAINKQIERDLMAIKERDHHWEDGIDIPYQAPPLSVMQRHYKFASTSSPDETTVYRALRKRVGRGGRTWLDRRMRPTRFGDADGQMHEFARYTPRFPNREIDEAEEEERAWRMSERWKYDTDDDMPVIGLDDVEEHDRVLVDDYDIEHLRHAMSLLGDQDIQNLTNDPTITVTGADGRGQQVVPFRLGFPLSMRQRPPAVGLRNSHATGIPLMAPPGASGASGSFPVHPNMMQGSVRISSGAGLQRGTPTPPVSQMSVPTLQVSPPHSGPVQTPISNGSASDAVNGPLPALPNGQNSVAQNQSTQPDSVRALDHPPSSTNSPVRPNSRNQHPSLPVNGFHLPAMNGYVNHLPNGSSYVHHASGNLSPQQVQVIQKVFAPSPQPGQGFAIPVNASNAQGHPAHAYVGHVPNAVNFNVPLSNTSFNLNLPPKQQMLWASHHPLQPPMNGQIANGLDANQLMGMNGSPNQNTNIQHLVPSIPGRAPSRVVMGRPPSVVHGSPTTIAHLIPHSSSPLLQHVAISSPQLHSSPRQSQASPSMQHQQAQQIAKDAPNAF